MDPRPDVLEQAVSPNGDKIVICVDDVYITGEWVKDRLIDVALIRKEEYASVG